MKTKPLLVLLLAGIWGIGSWWWYACKIKGFCGKEGDTAQLAAGTAAGTAAVTAGAGKSAEQSKTDAASATDGKANKAQGTADKSATGEAAQAKAASDGKATGAQAKADAASATDSKDSKAQGAADKSATGEAAQGKATADGKTTGAQAKADAASATDGKANKAQGTADKSATGDTTQGQAATDGKTTGEQAKADAASATDSKDSKAQGAADKSATEQSSGQARTDANQVTIQSKAGQGGDIGPATLNFPTGSTNPQLAAATQAYFKQLAQFLKDNPTAKVSIVGHTDNKGDPAKNRALGQKRADMLRDMLVKMGAPKERIQTQSEGADKPIADNNTEAGRKQNRRVEITPVK